MRSVESLKESIDLFYPNLFAMAQTTDLKFDVEILPLYVIVMKRRGLLPIQCLFQQKVGKLNGDNDVGKNKKAPKIVEALNVFTTE